MNRHLIFYFFIGVIFFASCTWGTTRKIDQSFLAENQRWKQQRLSELRQPDGWPTLVGLYWLEEGKKHSSENGRCDTDRQVVEGQSVRHATQIPDETKKSDCRFPIPADSVLSSTQSKLSGDNRGMCELLDKHEAAVILGISSSVLIRMVRDEQIPYIALPCGDGVRFSVSDLEEWIQSKRRGVVEVEHIRQETV